jgi:hypothetical protein
VGVGGIFPLKQSPVLLFISAQNLEASACSLLRPRIVFSLGERLRRSQMNFPPLRPRMTVPTLCVFLRF